MGSTTPPSVSSLPTVSLEKQQSIHDNQDIFEENDAAPQTSVLGKELESAGTCKASRWQSPKWDFKHLFKSHFVGRHASFTHPLSHIKTSEDHIVAFDGPDDAHHPINWPMSKKIITTALYGMTTMGATFASAVYSPATDQVASDFHVKSSIASLGTALLLFGFAFGPLIWAPLSEVYGRKLAVLTPSFISMIFAFSGGAARDIQTILICRFFQGFFGAAPVTNTGGVLGDIFAPEHRGAAIVGYSIAVVAGPNLGPIVGSAICIRTTWRWTQYVTGLFQGVVLIVAVFVLDETYPPAILAAKARRLRFLTGNWALHAKHEEWDISLTQLGKKYLLRPFQLLFTPICAAVATYASFVYGILYASLEAFPYVFEDLRGYNTLIASLPYLAMLLGAFLGMAANLLNQAYYIERWKRNNKQAVPEARLPPMMIGSIGLAVGMFLFAWTASPNILWLVPCIGVTLIGFGFITIFQAALNYLIDTFQAYSASAIGANTFLRSVMAASFSLFMTPVLSNLGAEWGLSIFGFVAVALLPIPYVFWVFGKKIRARGSWSHEFT